MNFRSEHDLLGELSVPEDVYYGIHTMRAAENFSVSGNLVHPELIKALGVVKQAAAEANIALGRLEQKVGRAISQAAGEVAQGHLSEQFIVDVFQGGAGTSTHMNTNEVIANRAIEILGGEKGDYRLVHPLDHVNLCQSTNDVYPTALHIAALRLLKPLHQAAAYLQLALQEKAQEFAGVLKVGRTQLQDAVPVTLGQEFAAYAEAVRRDSWRLEKAQERMLQINMGGTAVGTSINADKEYIKVVLAQLRELTGLKLAPFENLIDGTQNADGFVEVSGLIKTSATSLIKISGDLRLMGSGPRAGLGEITLPQLQAGSSIMPGKVNPVMTELVAQISYQVIAHDLAVTMAAQAGQLELNAFLPLIAANLLPALDTLAKTKVLFADKCIKGIAVNPNRCRQEVLNSTSILTILAARIGYEKATELAHQAIETGMSAKDVVLESGLISEEELESLLQLDNAIKAGDPVH